MKNRKLLSIFLALALLLAGCASTTTIVEESPEASETAAESPAASADPEASPGAGGEPGAGGAPGLGMENIVLGRVTDVTEGTVTLALLEPANLPEDAEASTETEEAAESAEDAILQLTLDEDGAIASVRVLDAEA